MTLQPCRLTPWWRQFVCRLCGRLISDCKIGTLSPDMIPTIEEIDSCAICSRNAKSLATSTT